MNKPFTELPAPKRTHRLSIVAVWNPIDPPTMQCEHTGCKQDDLEEISQCPVCGRWMCETCFGYQPVMVVLPRIDMDAACCSFPCCDDCAKLTNEERQIIMALRINLDQI